MVRTFDKKFKCIHFHRFEDTYFNSEYPSLDERVRWCYENMPEERLWCYEYEPYHNETNKRLGFPQSPVCRWNLIFFFEIEEDLMAFKLVYG